MKKQAFFVVMIFLFLLVISSCKFGTTTQSPDEGSVNVQPKEQMLNSPLVFYFYADW
ncbi:MAG: hypothetical protein KAS39_06860 [Actinomycetia bacterium]|nr:hypothetical protein [Actinomycetes bacterium]